jgi:peptide/nickel transport system substrate-binding protein
MPVSFRLMSLRTACLVGAVAVTLSAAAACSSSSSGTGGTGAGPTPVQSNTSIAVAPPKAGGTLTVLEGKGFSGDWPLGLDPATNTTGSADQDYYNALFGQLFELGTNGAVIPDLATSAVPSNSAKTWTIHLRPGVKFTDGTAFNADAVLWNLNRDLTSSCTCAPAWVIARSNPKVTTSAPVKGVLKKLDDLTVQVNLLAPDGAFLNQMFDSIPNWIASPAAYAKEGPQAFAKLPVGAGPFIIVSDTFSNQIVFKKNPTYWQAGRPYLDNLIFKSVASDESAYETLLAGQGQVYTDMSTPALLKESAQKFHVLNQQGTSPYDLQLNTKIAPFNSVKARQAIYAATDFAPILQHVFANAYPAVQGFTGPGGICYNASVAGYQGYNLALAKQLVKASGLDKAQIQLGTISNQVAQDTTAALKSEWAAAGITNVTIASWDLNGLIQAFLGGKWQAMIQTAGSYDPAAGVGVGFRFLSTSPFSGVHDPRLDSMLNKASALTDIPSRCAIYNQAASYIAKNFYGPFYFAFAPANVSISGVGGPGLSTPLPAVVVTPTVLWESVYYNPAGA